MNLEQTICQHWHVPTAALAYLKLLLKNREIEIENNIDAWKHEIEQIQYLSNEEQTLLEVIIKRIDEKQTDFTLDVLFGLIKDTAIRYLNNRYVLMKYLKNVTYDDSWNGWYIQTRGCVIDLEKMKLVSATMRKFYNINEKFYTSYEQVSKKAKEGKVTSYVKQDGSCIAMSYQDELMVTTPGSFESKQVVWATEYLHNHHEEFLEDAKEKMSHITFVFEYVGPENRVVVFYKKSDMVLLHMIDSTTGRMFSYDEVVEMAKRYGFTPCTVVEDDLKVLMTEKDDAEKYRAENIEGWVIRIDKEDETFMVKLKCTDYVQMHHMISNVLNPKWVYESMVDETLDDNIAMIENDEVKEIVIRIRQKIKDWEKSVKAKANLLYQSVPKELWISDKELDEYRSLEHDINRLVKEHPKEDKIKKFLENFSKGKLHNESEEVRVKATELFQESPIDKIKLEEYDAYKTFVSKRIKEIIAEIKEAFNRFVFNGEKNTKYGAWLEEKYPHFYDIAKGCRDVEEWEKQFEEDKTEFYRLAQISKHNLTPEYFDIHEYAKKKYAFMQEVQVIIPLLKKQATDYVWREAIEVESILEEVIEKDWIINDDLYVFYLNKKHFEEYQIAEKYPNERDSVINQIIKEYYLFVRGQETDNSYEFAKEIYDKLDENKKDQKEFYKKKGLFSAYVNKHVAGPYRNFIFDLFEQKTYEKEQYIREKQFLSYANLVTDESKDYMHEFDVDFRDIKEWTNSVPMEE